MFAQIARHAVRRLDDPAAVAEALGLTGAVAGSIA
jgi:hypothetical protein